MKITVVDQKGKKVSDLELESSVFEAEVSSKVIPQYVFSYLSNQREANAHTKDRSEVSGGGKKPWKQKGTGRARFGSSRNPIWRGGGIAFGPTNARNFKKKVTKKFRLVAFRAALTAIAANNSLKVVDSLDFDSKKPLTAQALDFVAKQKIEKKFSIVTLGTNTNVLNAFSNVQKANVIRVEEINPYDIVNAGTLIFESKALENLVERLKVEKK